MPGSRDDQRPTSRGMLLAAAAVSLVIGSFVPFGDLLLYPFTLLATWVHEMGHGLMALAVGGGFDKLEIFADASGLAYTRHAGDVQSALVSLGGLIAPALAGALILIVARGPRRAQLLLAGLALALLASLALWVRSLAGFISVPLVAALLLALVRWGSPRERMFLAQFLGLRLALDTLGRGLDYLFTDSVTVAGEQRASDIAAVAEGFGGPRLLWSLGVAALCIALVVIGLAAAWRAPHARSPSRSSV